MKLFTVPILANVFFLATGTAFAQRNVGYEEGMKAFRKRDYSTAAKFFYPVVTTAAGDTKSKAEFGLAESLRELNMPYGASYFYSRIVAQGNRSDFFRPSMEALGKLNARVPLGRTAVKSLFAKKVDPLEVPPAARGFYFFDRGITAFENKNANVAKTEFERVPANSEYYPKAQYYLGIIVTTQSKSFDQAINHFNSMKKADPSDAIRELADLSLARVYYEKKDYKRSLYYYSQIPRDSDNWLETLFEASWAFFMLQKHNNSLGNIHTIHSPFFSMRFYPETYIVQAISYLKLCRYEDVKNSLKSFQERYRPTFADLNSLLRKYQGQPAGFFSTINRFKSQGGLSDLSAANEVLDSISRSDTYKEAVLILRSADREKLVLGRYASRWTGTGLADVLRQSLDQRKATTVAHAGDELYAQSVAAFKYLKDLSNQTRLINLEMLSGRTNELRAKLSQESLPDNTLWGEGMKPLNLSKELEYWPFEGEYWEDELGGYVYNIDSRCLVSKNLPKKEGAKR